MKAEIWTHKKFIKETDPLILKSLFTGLLRASKFDVINISEHHFKPIGWTALWLLSESHFAIHTFPESEKSYVEIASCSLEKYNNFLILLNEIE